MSKLKKVAIGAGVALVLAAALVLWFTFQVPGCSTTASEIPANHLRLRSYAVVPTDGSFPDTDLPPFGSIIFLFSTSCKQFFTSSGFLKFF
jgi:hypothetical protein